MIQTAWVSPHVTGAAFDMSKIVRAFEFMPLNSAPAGFEPALTAPERNAVHPPDLVRRATLHRLGECMGGARRLATGERPREESRYAIKGARSAPGPGWPALLDKRRARMTLTPTRRSSGRSPRGPFRDRDCQIGVSPASTG
jgi:hypothetical protein